MTCERTVELLSDRLAGLLSDDDAARLDGHLGTCAACREEADAIDALWADMGSIEDDVPSERMRARFHAALAAYEDRARTSTMDRWLERVWPRRPVLQLATAAALLVVGLVAGRALPTSTDREIAALREDVRTVGVVLLGHQSASERLRGVEWAARAPAAGDDRAVAALLDTLRNDPSVNVRLAAAEALRSRADRPDVAHALADALDAESAPLMQVTLARVLIESGADGAETALRRTLDREGLDPAVRDFLRDALDEAAAGRPADSEV